jgi:hypothetical protein
VQLQIEKPADEEVFGGFSSRRLSWGADFCFLHCVVRARELVNRERELARN